MLQLNIISINFIIIIMIFTFFLMFFFLFHYLNFFRKNFFFKFFIKYQKINLFFYLTILNKKIKIFYQFINKIYFLMFTTKYKKNNRLQLRFNPYQIIKSFFYYFSKPDTHYSKYKYTNNLFFNIFYLLKFQYLFFFHFQKQEYKKNNFFMSKNIYLKKKTPMIFSSIELPPIQSIIKEHLINYPTPINFTYMWSFGSLAGLFLMIQIISGLFLAMHYTPHIEHAFLSVEHIMRDVNYGWLLRYTHSNGASFFFIMLYLHIAKALYYQSYVFPFLKVWRIGLLIFLISMAIAFLGYVLPWGQMSFWGATVITNLFTAIPVIGNKIVFWLWGGFSVSNATLMRFFVFHFVLPFVLIGLIFLHLILLHIPGSSNPLKISDTSDKINFYPYFYLKDLFSFFCALFFFSFLVFLFPNFLAHSDNYIEANPLVTPTHIVPEWYFLPFYAILRSIPNKLQGVILMLFAIIYFFFLPYHRYFFVKFLFHRKLFYVNKNPNFRPFYRFFFWVFCLNLLLLGYIGGQPVEDPYIILGQFSTFFYFVSFIFWNLSIVIDKLNINNDY